MGSRWKTILKSSYEKCETERHNFLESINNILQQQKLLLDNVDKFDTDELLNNCSNIMEITNFNDVLANKLYFVNLEFETKWEKYKKEINLKYKDKADVHFEAIEEINTNGETNVAVAYDVASNGIVYSSESENLSDTHTTGRSYLCNSEISEVGKGLTECTASILSLKGRLAVLDSSTNELSKNVAANRVPTGHDLNKPYAKESMDELNAVPNDFTECKEINIKESINDSDSATSYVSYNLADYNIPSCTSNTNGSLTIRSDISLTSESDRNETHFYSAANESSEDVTTSKLNVPKDSYEKSIESIFDKCKPKGRFDRKSDELKCIIPDLSFVKDYSSSDSVSTSSREAKSNGYVAKNPPRIIKKKNQSWDKNSAIKITNKTYPVILERDIPNINDLCIITYTVNPFEFYINLLNEDFTSSLELQLEEYARKRPYFTNKLDAKLAISEYCIAYSEIFGTWNRAKIIKWNMTDPQNVDIQYVDFGEHIRISYKCLMPIPNGFCNNPKQAIRCRLANVLPLTGDNKWPENATKNFNLICFDDTEYLKFQIVSISQEGEELLVDLKPIEGMDLTISEMMIMTGHANPIKTEFKRNLMIEQIKHAQGSEGESDAEALDKFCNDLPVTYNNIAESMLGYDAQDDLRLCKFARPDGTCFKGSHCKLEHRLRRKDGITTDTEEVLVAPESKYLPNINDAITVLITFIKTPTMLYGQVNHPENKNGTVVKDLYKYMNKPDMVKSYESFKINPAIGELIIAKNVDGRWYRATVLEIIASHWSKLLIVQVFFVDFGDILELSCEHIRKMTPGFANYPYQAIPFRISNIKPMTTEFKYKLFTDFVESNNNKKCQVIVTYAGANFIQGIFTDSFGNDVGEELVKKGLAEPCNPIEMLHTNSSNILID